MKRCSLNVLFVAIATLGQAEANILRQGKKADLVNGTKLNPPLKDVVSDKKFFGPPFPADYPDDRRPAIDKNLLKQVKSGPKDPYPALQSKDTYDKDYVKDENNDAGAWQAQFEYDELRKKLNGEEEDERKAEEDAAKEGGEVDGAEKDADAAGKKVKDAQKGVDDASKGEDDEKHKGDGADGPPSAEKLKELEKKLKEAEEKYEKQKKAFEECKAQLDAAKKELEELKAQTKAMEEKLAGDTKLWVEKKASAEMHAAEVKLNLQKSKEAKQKSASEKVTAAQEKLAAAEKVKAEMEKALAKEKAEHEKAKKDLQKEKADVVNIKKQVDGASLRLKGLGKYKPAAATVHAEPKNGAAHMSLFMSTLVILATRMI